MIEMVAASRWLWSNHCPKNNPIPTEYTDHSTADSPVRPTKRPVYR